jgi:hypothetical protein
VGSHPPARRQKKAEKWFASRHGISCEVDVEEGRLQRPIPARRNATSFPMPTTEI